MSESVNQTSLRVTNLRKVYHKGQSNEELVALNDISFELRKGEILGVIGSNGAGKSTLLKILSEITAPTSGEVEYHGRLTSILDIGTGFHPDLSGRENTFLNGSVLGFSKKEVTAAYPNIVAFSGLEDYMDMPVKQYSSGMYLRLAFSIAFHFPVDILLVDEVIAVGDAEFKQKCYDRIVQIVAAGASIILVSHSSQQIAEYCHRCMLLESGSLKKIGPVHEVMEAYLGLDRGWNIAQHENDKVRLVSATVKGQKHPLPIGLEDDINIELILEKLHSGSSLEAFLYLYDLNGTRILMDSIALRSGYLPAEQPRGLLEITCTISGNLLNLGIYTVGIMVTENLDRVAEWHEVARFKVELAEGDKNMEFLAEMACAIKPALNWNYKKISH